ncbi:hypothetical protein ACFL17_03735 [Pseudomonadota bacterium]
MSDKQKLIDQMLAMQKKFIAYEQENGLDPADYFNPPSGHQLENYKAEYDKLATQLVDMAHEEQGSKR